MKKATMLLTLVALMLAVAPAWAQTQVTVRQLNSIPQNQIDQLNTLGTDVTESDLADTGEGGNALIFDPALLQQQVQFTAVLLTDPRNSGLSTPSDGLPSRIHVFVRDTTAASQGNEGMTIQIVDGDWQSTGLLDFGIGDVVTIVGLFDPFFSTSQVSPTSFTLVDPSTYDLPASIFDPVVVETSDINMSVDNAGGVLPNWDNLPDLFNQYVRLENVTVQARAFPGDGRPNWLVSSDGGTTVVGFYDTSLRFRNDRNNSYDENLFNPRDDDFVPPPPGTVVNLQGFLNFQNDDPFDRSPSEDVILSIIPFDDSDLEILESPPIITDLSIPDAVPGAEDLEITAVVNADPNRTISTVQLGFTTSSSPEETLIDPTSVAGDVYTFSLPAQADGDFVSYFIRATDNTGAVSDSDPVVTRFLSGGIDEISDIQETADGGFGPSPFLGLTTEMDLTVTVQSQPSVSGIISVQDDADLDPFTGIVIFDSDLLALNRGDVINITEASITEFRDVTQLSDVTFSVESTGGNFLGYKEVTTTALQNEEIAEAHEGMLLRFNDVVVINPQADAPSDFGEFTFATQGTTDEVRSDDASDGVPGDFDNTLTAGDTFAFIQGIWSYSFGNYKLIPETVEMDINTALDDALVPGSFALGQNFPNPFSVTTAISYEVGATSHVTLEVFDVLGRKVATLVDGMQAAGTQTATLDAAALPSGVYLYRLTAGTAQQSRTMLLMK